MGAYGARSQCLVPPLFCRIRVRANLLFGNRLSILIGEASYSIYLLQIFTIIFGNVVLRRLHVHSRSAAVLLEILTGIIMIGAGILCFLYVEEPIRQWVLRRFSGRTAGEEGIRPAPPAPLAADTQVSSTIG